MKERAPRAQGLLLGDLDGGVEPGADGDEDGGRSVVRSEQVDMLESFIAHSEEVLSSIDKSLSSNVELAAGAPWSQTVSPSQPQILQTPGPARELVPARPTRVRIDTLLAGPDDEASTLSESEVEVPADGSKLVLIWRGSGWQSG